MRNMSFSMTKDQMYEGTKTVTRRIGWWDLRPGDVLWAVEKCQGLKKGEMIKRIGMIAILNTHRERLNEIKPSEVYREGFPDLYVNDFIKMFCEKMKCTPETEVNRIEFKPLYDASAMV